MGEIDDRKIEYASLLLYAVDFSYHTPYTILDARPKSIFESSKDDQEHHSQLIGFIPSSKNIPSDTLIGDDGLFLKPEELVKLFDEKDIDLKNPICTIGGRKNSNLY